MKLRETDVFSVLLALERIGGIGLTTRIKKEISSLGLGTTNVRKALRALKRKGYIKTDRPMLPDSLENRWELLNKSE